MQIIYIILAVASVPAMFVLSNLFCSGFRESGGIGMLLNSQELLRKIVTTTLIQSPPAGMNRLTIPRGTGYAFNIEAFETAHQKSRSLGRKILRPFMWIVLFGGALAGLAAFSWWVGLIVLILNSVTMGLPYIALEQGAIGGTAMQGAVEYVQTLAVVLSRWHASAPSEAQAWVQSRPEMKELLEVVKSLPTSNG